MSHHYQTHGDPYSDPPRARVCSFCGALVGDETQHDLWHEPARPKKLIAEDEIDYNTVVIMGEDAVLQHTYSRHCPPGCDGQKKECHYKKE